MKRELLEDGSVRHLKERNQTVAQSVLAGNYNAVEYVDYAADGWVEATCPELVLEVPKRVAAYAVIAPPVFFPLVSEEEVITWWKHSTPPDLVTLVWPEHGPPEPLSYNRFPANIMRLDARFDPQDQTITAIVTQAGCGGEKQARVPAVRHRRVSALPDRGSNTFAPGWDTAVDFNSPTPAADAVKHLAAYGLASPFADDAMICAGESAFWPAATPDISRSLPPASDPITTPLPDELLDWDGLPAPKLVGKYVEYIAPDYADYVQAILDKRLRFGRIARVTPQEFNEWTLIMARAFQALGVTEISAKARWGLLHFQKYDAAQSSQQTRHTFSAGHSYWLEMFRAVSIPQDRVPLGKARVGIELHCNVYADPTLVAWKDVTSTSPAWNTRAF